MSLLDRFRLPPRTRRRFERIGAGTLMVIGYPFRLVIGLGRATVGMVANWWESRNLRYLLRGLPALVAAIGIIVVGSLVFFQDRSALAQSYKETGDRALMAIIQKHAVGQDAKAALAMAETCYQRLALLPCKKDENDFRLAQTRLFSGVREKQEGAYSIFEELALPYRVTDRTLEALTAAEAPKATVAKVAPLKDIPFEADALMAKLASVLDRDEYNHYLKVILNNSSNPTYGPAHYYIADRLWNRGNATNQNVVLAEQHFRKAIIYDVGREAAQARLTLFDILRLVNRADEAEKMLEEACDRLPDDPECRVKLARWYITGGKRDKAEKQTQLATNVLERKLNENPSDDRNRFQLIDATGLYAYMLGTRGDFKRAKEKYAYAEKLCDNGKVLCTQPDLALQYRFLLYTVLLSQYDATANEPDSFAERFRLLEKALLLLPSHPAALMRLQIYLRDSGPERDKAMKYIDDSIDKGGSQSAIALLVKGTYLWEKDDVAGAKYYWEKALEQQDYIPDVANNLAWVLVFNVRPPEFERALTLVKAAIQKDDKPQYHGTMGHILAKMGGHDREALDELDKAKQAYAGDPAKGNDLYVRLSEVCERLGMRAESERYRKVAEEIRAKYPAIFRQAAPAAPAAPASPPTGSPSTTNPAAGSPTPMNPATTPDKKDATGGPAAPARKP